MTNGEEDRGPVKRLANVGVFRSDHTQDLRVVVRGLSRPASEKKPNALTERAMTIGGVGAKEGSSLVMLGKRGLDRRTLSIMADKPRTEPAMIPMFNDRITLDGISIRRMKDKKKCSTCFKGSHLLFSNGPYLHWRRCRRHLTTIEKALLVLLRTQAEAGGLTN